MDHNESGEDGELDRRKGEREPVNEHTMLLGKRNLGAEKIKGIRNHNQGGSNAYDRLQRHAYERSSNPMSVTWSLMSDSPSLYCSAVNLHRVESVA